MGELARGMESAHWLISAAHDIFTMGTVRMRCASSVRVGMPRGVCDVVAASFASNNPSATPSVILRASQRGETKGA